MRGSLGPEEWQCYHCMSAKIATSDKEVNSGLKNINISEIKEQVSKETEQWKETVEEITNQKLVKAQIYLKQFNNRQRHSGIHETTKSISDLLGSDDETSLFNSVDFPLKLAPGIES